MFYQSILRPFLFTLEPERAHNTILGLLKITKNLKPLCCILSYKFSIEDPILEQDLFGCHFNNPVGLAAGYDKNCEIFSVAPCFGFGFVECGTVTAQDQSGNASPRVFRLEEDRALINRLGFNNRGATWVESQLKKTKRSIIPMGINIGKSKATEIDKAP